mgnify:FL=1
MCVGSHLEPQVVSARGSRFGCRVCDSLIGKLLTRYDLLIGHGEETQSSVSAVVASKKDCWDPTGKSFNGYCKIPFRKRQRYA